MITLNSTITGQGNTDPALNEIANRIAESVTFAPPKSKMR